MFPEGCQSLVAVGEGVLDSRVHLRIGNVKSFRLEYWVPAKVGGSPWWDNTTLDTEFKNAFQQIWSSPSDLSGITLRAFMDITLISPVVDDGKESSHLRGSMASFFSKQTYIQWNLRIKDTLEPYFVRFHCTITTHSHESCL